MEIAAILAVALEFALVFGVPVAGLLIGLRGQRRHLRELARREAMPGAVLSNLRALPPGVTSRGAFLVRGSVVLAAHPGQMMLAQLRKIVGGPMGSLNILMERARREALLRLRDSAGDAPGTLVLNVRLETAMLRRGTRAAQQAVVEVIAYGTAIVVDPPDRVGTHLGQLQVPVTP